MCRAPMLVIVALIFPPAVASTARAAVYVVNPLGTGDFPTIQAALDACIAGDEIELTRGIFQGEGNRDLDFHGKSIVLRAQSRDQRNCVIDCQGTEADPHRGFHFRSAEGPGSVVQGISIGGGWSHRGGGVLCEAPAAPSFVACTFFDHRAQSGAGAHVVGGSLFTDCVFTGNVASYVGGGVDATGNPEFVNCEFRVNTARFGAGLYLYESNAAVVACVFIGNEAESGGGGVHCEMPGTPVLRNCTFAGNTSGNVGGGLTIFVDCTPTLSGCTFAFNGAASGGGIWIGPLCGAVLENTLIAFSTAGQAVWCPEGEARLTCCDLFGNAGGDWVGPIAEQYGSNGNICANPLFCGPASEDYRLEASSPCAPFSPHNPECDLVGAWPVGCGTTPVEIITWGKLKHSFR